MIDTTSFYYHLLNKQVVSRRWSYWLQYTSWIIQEGYNASQFRDALRGLSPHPGRRVNQS